MTSRYAHKSPRRWIRLDRVAYGLLAMTLAASTACDSLLSVDNPGNVPADALADPNLVATLEIASASSTSLAGQPMFGWFAARGLSPMPTPG